MIACLCSESASLVGPGCGFPVLALTWSDKAAESSWPFAGVLLFGWVDMVFFKNASLLSKRMTFSDVTAYYRKKD